MQGGGSAAPLRLEGGSTRRDAGTQPGQQMGPDGGGRGATCVLLFSSWAAGVCADRGGGARKLESITKYGNVYRRVPCFPRGLTRKVK